MHAKNTPNLKTREGTRIHGKGWAVVRKTDTQSYLATQDLSSEIEAVWKKAKNSTRPSVP